MGTCVHLSDTSPIHCSEKLTVWDLAHRVFPKKAHKVVGAFVNQQKTISDLRTVLGKGDQVHLVFIPSKEALEVIRHSAAHVLAHAVQVLWPDVKVTIGPVIDNGFYYDFDSPRAFQPEDLTKIEKKMQEIIQHDLELSREVWTKDKAVGTFQDINEPYKVEIIQGIEEEKVSIYRQFFVKKNDKNTKDQKASHARLHPTSPVKKSANTYSTEHWFDLCRGPHVKNLQQIGAVKVLHQSGAYWRGDENQKQLQRIYGTAFHSKKELDLYLHNLEEARRRDHRSLGKKMGLFYFSSLAPGSPFFTPDGAGVYNTLKRFLKTMYAKYHYEEVITPQVFSKELFRRSGHAEHFSDNMYPVLDKSSLPATSVPQTSTDLSVQSLSATDSVQALRNKPPPAEEAFFLKPMNCPGHCVLYSMKKHSYKDLPWRVADFGRLHRREKKGTLHGLTRVTSLCQDDAHIFCTGEQLDDEILSCLNMFREVYQILGLDNYRIALSTRPEQSMGQDKIWNQAEQALTKALKKSGMDFTVQQGEGAFYGPKLDWQFVDAMNRPWQLGTLQCDFNMPQAFGLQYTDSDNQDKCPILLHRAVLGSLERFIGVYLEHRDGYLPLWLSPVAVLLINVSREQESYVKELEQKLCDSGVRVKTDLRGEKLGYKIREARLCRVPCLVVVGEKEQKTHTLSVRCKNGETFQLPYQDFINRVSHIVKTKQLDEKSFLKENKQ